MRPTLFLLFVFLFSLPAFAQVSLGLRASYGYADLRSDASFENVEDQFNNASSLSFGALLEVPVSPVISIRSGAEINRRGTTFTARQLGLVFGATVPNGAEAKTRFTYVDIPLLIQANIPAGNVVEPYLFAGPTFGFATVGNVRISTNGGNGSSLMTNDIDLDAIDYERFHIAALVGVGVRAKLGDRLTTFLEARYERSFSDPYQVPLTSTTAGYEGVQFGAGFAFILATPAESEE